MKTRWTDWLTRPDRWKNFRHGPTRREPKHRPLIIEQIEDRLMLSTAAGTLQANGGFIDLGGFRFNSVGASSIYEATTGSSLSVGGTGSLVVTGQGGVVPVQHPAMLPIPREGPATAPSEGGMIDLTRRSRHTEFDRSDRLLRRPTGAEDVARASANVGEVIASMRTPAGMQPEISFAAISPAALPTGSLPNEASPVSFSVPARDCINGSRGRSRAFELAIGLPTATSADEYYTNVGRFSSGHSFGDTLAEPLESIEESADVVPLEEADEKRDPAAHEDNFDRLRTQERHSTQKADPGGADIRAAHRDAVFAETAGTESDPLLPGVSQDRRWSVQVASVLTLVAAGHYLTASGRQHTDANRRRIWLPRRRRPL